MGKYRVFYTIRPKTLSKILPLSFTFLLFHAMIAIEYFSYIRTIFVNSGGNVNENTWLLQRQIRASGRDDRSDERPRMLLRRRSIRGNAGKKWKDLRPERSSGPFFNSAGLIKIDIPYTKDELAAILYDMLAKMDDKDIFIYWQMTRGTGIRQHQFPEKEQSRISGSS